MPAHHHPARKKFTRFASKQPFQFGLPNVSPDLVQASDNSPAYLTRTSSLLRQQILANAPSVKIISDSVQPDVLARDAWADTDFDRKRVLFLIPDDAIGDCVGMVLFLRAFATKYPGAKIAVLNSGTASDIFATIPDITIFQLFISAKRLKTFDYLIDFSEMEGWKDLRGIRSSADPACIRTRTETGIGYENWHPANGLIPPSHPSPGTSARNHRTPCTSRI